MNGYVFGIKSYRFFERVSEVLYAFFGKSRNQVDIYIEAVFPRRGVSRLRLSGGMRPSYRF